MMRCLQDLTAILAKIVSIDHRKIQTMKIEILIDSTMEFQIWNFDKMKTFWQHLYHSENHRLGNRSHQTFVQSEECLIRSQISNHSEDR